MKNTDRTHTEHAPKDRKEQAYPAVELEGEMPVIPEMYSGQPLIEEGHEILCSGCGQSGAKKQEEITL